MRPIKFRAWDKQVKRMFYSDKFGLSELFYTIEDGQINGVIMQYTGLKDKNGKEIYEGDILDFYLRGSVWYVIWSKEKLAWMAHNPQKIWEDEYLYELANCNPLIVIGNIYQNPELLKKRT